MAGAAARTAVVFVTSPLELMRVRMQGGQQAAPPGQPYGRHVMHVARQLYHEGAVRAHWVTVAMIVPLLSGVVLLPLKSESCPPLSRVHVQLLHLPVQRFAVHILRCVYLCPLQGFRGFWRGIGPTLAKDVPFAAGYWALLEPLRTLLLTQPPVLALLGVQQQLRTSSSPSEALLPSASTVPASGQPHTCQGPSRAQIYMANAAAGFCAAAITAGATTPLDVVKTRAQMGMSHQISMAQSLRQILGSGGVRALFVGAGPRSMRAGCAYAILMSCYEAFKALQVPSAP